MIYVNIILVFLKIVGAVLGRVDEASRRKIIVAACDALRIKVEDEIVDRAVAAYDAALDNADDVQHPGRHYRD